MWFIGVEEEQEMSAPPPKKNPGSAPDTEVKCSLIISLRLRAINVSQTSLLLMETLSTWNEWRWSSFGVHCVAKPSMDPPKR